MKPLIYSLFIIIAISGCTTNADTASEKSKPVLKAAITPVIESFFKKIAANQTDAAINDLLSTNENISVNDSSIIDLKFKLSNVTASSGKYVDHKLLKEKEIAGSFALCSYLVRYDKKFYRFFFEFYNNGTTTKIYKFRFDATADIEAEEALRLYLD